MLIKFRTPQKPQARLDLRKSDESWELWDREELIEGKIKFDDKSLGLDHYKVIICEDGVSAKIVRFADIHRHSYNSLMDGMTAVSTMVERTEYAGALTDHGNMYGFLDFP